MRNDSGSSGVQSCLCGSGLNPASALTSLGLRFLCAPKAGSWLGVCRKRRDWGRNCYWKQTSLHCDYKHTHSHTHTSPLSMDTQPLPRHSSSPSPLPGTSGVGGAEDRPKTQPVSLLLYETWVVHPHCMSHQESLGGLTEKGHSVLYPRDITPRNPSPLLRTPTWVQLGLLLCPPTAPAPPFTPRPQPSAALEAAEWGTETPAAPGPERVSQTLVEAGGS